MNKLENIQLEIADIINNWLEDGMSVSENSLKQLSGQITDYLINERVIRPDLTV